jgi:Nucleotidyl transferase AbiEii toxin, Type IV TA system
MANSISNDYAMRQVDSPKTASLLAGHMTAAEIYDSVTNGGANDFAEVVGVLNRNKPWCLIGGLAVNCFVEPVYTVDVDVVVVAANLEQIGRELENAGFRVKRFEHSVNAQRPGSKLNVQFTTDARYQDFLAGAIEHDVLGVAVPVASLEDIVRGKVWAWQDKQRRTTKRKKDELDLLRIAEAHPELRQLIPAEIVKQL